ncbi:dephospho-CoA kinase [Woodsholea maritima]|uniref:dephospho-CoA kinase n=1 Tax=Woodsholea maritima TaxID=240237 RepID=UPI00036C398D|nr:dephospho-CoA kinase [Woodsholea maritima]
MIKIGLTGSIGMGKSTTAKMLADMGYPVFDADQTVADLYAQGGKAVEPVAARFPSALNKGAIDRVLLSQALNDDPKGFADLEAIVHPLVDEARQAFFAEAEANGHTLVILDIPLLFEAGLDRLCDVIWVVSAPEDHQRARVLAREGMSEAKFAAIVARQMPDAHKRARADAVIDTSQGLEVVREHLQTLIENLSVKGS